MKKTATKELLQFIYAILIGLVAEAVYFVVIEYANYYSNFDGFFCIFFLYVAVVGVIVATVIKRYCKRTGSVIDALKVLTALIAGVWLHMMIMKHDTVVYYHMHGEFYPITDDLGYFFFMAYLGVVYLIWMPEAVFLVIKGLIKGVKENAKRI